MDLRKLYRAWMWRRLAFLLPSFMASLGVIGWLGAYRPFPMFLRVPCLTVAVVLTALVGYLLVQTLEAARLGLRRPHQEARAHRRQLRAWAPILGLSLCLLALLFRIPFLFPVQAVPPASPRLAVRARRPQPPPSFAPATGSLPLPTEETTLVVDVLEEAPAPSPAEAVAAAQAPAPIPVPVPVTVSVHAAQGKPEIRPELTLEPSHLVLHEQDLRWTGLVEIPLLPTAPGGGALTQVPSKVPEDLAKDLPKAPAPEPTEAIPDENGASPFRLDRELHAAWPSANGFLLGITYRPLPEEGDTESWPFPEGRLEGFLLLGSGGDRVPGIAFVFELPLRQKDSVLASWTGARLPAQEGKEPGVKPNWDHLTVGYFRRLMGYTRQATFDLGASVGVATDFLHAVEGVADSGGTPKFAPYAAIDLAFWQQQPIGLLLHFSEAFPVTLLGSSLGTTDLSAQIRWDLSERVSLHGGYRMVLLRYKFDGVSPTGGADPLHEALSGPIMGLDVRF